jgi:hypothetical protein
MQTDHIVALLIAERDKLDRAIGALQGPIKRRGRPPKNTLAVAPATPTAAASSIATSPARKKRRFSAAQRKQQAERMRHYWAAKRSAEAKPVAKAASKAKP